MKRKPGKLRLLEGNPSKRPIPVEPEPSEPAKVVDCPLDLSPVAIEEWIRLCEDMAAKGVLTSWDRGAMAAYCQSYADWLAAQAKVDAEGAVVLARFGPAPSAYWLVVRQAKADMLRFAAELGLAPVARARIGAAEEAPQSASDVPAEFRDVSGG